MSTKMVDIDPRLMDGPQSGLERKLIAEYLHAKGFKPSDLKNLPKQEACDLMKEACRYATLKLAEIEARSKFRRKIEAPD